MTPGARTQATIELLGEILQSWEKQIRIPADKQVDQYFKAHRFMGSKDRSFVGELTYWILRHLASLRWHVSAQLKQQTDESRLLVLAALILRKEFDTTALAALMPDNKYAPAALTHEETRLCKALEKQTLDNPDMPHEARFNYPKWLGPHLTQSLGKNCDATLASLNTQAPTDLRTNTLKTTREELLLNLKAEGFDVAPTSLSPLGIRLKKRAPIFTSAYFKQGHFEVQDEGSQMISRLVDAKSGQRVIDFCAGAGGKTLGIAAAMKNKGRILAWDTSEKRLTQIHERLRRAGVDTVETHVITNENDAFIKRHKYSADRVLVDVPCSGTGTWRRNPDLKWRFSEQNLLEITRTQQSILRSAARLVKPGGRLIYATCSLLAEENENQIKQFLVDNKEFRVVCAKKIWDNGASDTTSEVSYFWVTPHQDGVDGFFAAILERLETKK